MRFDWSRLPKEKYNEFIVYVEGGFKKKLLEMHNKYRLSSFDYNACCNLDKLLNRCESAVRRGVVYKIE